MRRRDRSGAARIRLGAREMVHACRMLADPGWRQLLRIRSDPVSERRDDRCNARLRIEPSGGAWEDSAVKGGGGPSWR